ncbi:MAG: NAD(P)/FAD-dependent oxidoreductase, partial [Deltaproteobacteria bacterium]|nr:NAD(P)/FAD-dependent oxidoreductase [Deltaproteobacteria bacterium]
MSENTFDATLDASLIGQSPEELGFDPDALRAKYRQERDKRIRPESTGQFIEVTGEFSHFAADPFAGARVERAPLEDEVEVVIVGAGHCGLLAAVRLMEAGVTDLRIIDGAADVGGTWYWNRYPGIRCDIESYTYMPLIEEIGTMPEEKYAAGAAIFENARKIAKKYDLYDKTCLQTHVEETRWDEAEKKWTVKTDRGDAMKARFLIMALGPLNRPKLPGIPGIQDFKGHAFHTSRWDYEYTGGDPSGDFNMHKLHDKRVGIIGTGCTGIQCAPRLAEHAQHLYVFQRTPSAVAARNNRPTDPDWASSLTPGWQERRSDNFNAILQGLPVDEDLVADGWTRNADIQKTLFSLGADASPQETAVLGELVDFQRMNEIRDRVDDIVEDEKTAAGLKAWYRLFCKRPSFSDNWLPMFNRPNVTLVDTKGRGVTSFNERGAVVDGAEYELDCVIFATGYEVGTDYSRRGQLEIHGRDGVRLSDHWSEHMKTLHGLMSHGFPNCFHMGVFIQNPLIGNFTALFTSQAQRIAQIVKAIKERDLRSIEPTAAAETDWVETVRQSNGDNLEFFVECTPGYYNAEGEPESGDGLFYEIFGGGEDCQLQRTQGHC